MKIKSLLLALFIGLTTVGFAQKKRHLIIWQTIRTLQISNLKLKNTTLAALFKVNQLPMNSNSPIQEQNL